MTSPKNIVIAIILFAACPLSAAPPAPVNESVSSPTTSGPWTNYNLGAVKRIAFDQAGDMWLATYGGGVIRWKPGSKTFTRFTTADGLKTNNLWTIAVSQDNRIWTAGGPFNYPGVSYFDGINWRTLTDRDGLVDNYVNAIAAGGEKGMWFGTDKGVSNLKESAWTTYKRVNGLAGDTIISIFNAPGGDLWFGTSGSGASRFDGAKWVTYTAQDGLPSNMVVVLGAASENAIWFGSVDEGGVSCFQNGTWRKYTQANGLVGAWCESFAAESDGTLWFGSCSCGVTRFDGTTGTPYRTFDGLPDPYVYTVAVAPDGVVWVGSDNGVSCFNGSSLSVNGENFPPEEFSLLSNYPNPFNPETSIRYSLPKTSPNEITIHNLLGQKIRTLVNKFETGGTHVVRWDGRDNAGQPVAGGIYFCRMQTPEWTRSNKMLLLK